MSDPIELDADTNSIYGARTKSEDACRAMLSEAIGLLEDAAHNVDMAVGGDFSTVTHAILAKVANNIQVAMDNGNICQQSTQEAQGGSAISTKAGHDTTGESPSGAGDDGSSVVMLPLLRLRGSGR